MTNHPIEGIAGAKSATPSQPNLSWRRYFGFSTDHKVIGIQYICHHVHLLFNRWVVLDGDARRTAHPRIRSSGPASVQRLVHDARDDDDLPVDYSDAGGSS